MRSLVGKKELIFIYQLINLFYLLLYFYFFFPPQFYTKFSFYSYHLLFIIFSLVSSISPPPSLHFCVENVYKLL
jgi:hypothetical protein